MHLHQFQATEWRLGREMSTLGLLAKSVAEGLSSCGRSMFVKRISVGTASLHTMSLLFA